MLRMRVINLEINIANNIKTVELLKVELLQKVTDLFGDISAETDSETAARLADDAAALINIAFVMAARLGIDYESVGFAMGRKLKQEIDRGHFIERRYGDLSALLGYIGSFGS